MKFDDELAMARSSAKDVEAERDALIGKTNERVAELEAAADRLATLTPIACDLGHMTRRHRQLATAGEDQPVKSFNRFHAGATINSTIGIVAALGTHPHEIARHYQCALCNPPARAGKGKAAGAIRMH